MLSTTFVLLHLLLAAAQVTTLPGDDATVSLCLAKTINHITHTLPQQCLKGSWTSPTSESAPVETESPAHESQPSELEAPESTATDADTPTRQHDKPILSFEEWKELMLRQHGQDPADLQERQRSESAPRAAEPADPGPGTFGEEGEISLNFDVPPVPTQDAAGAHASPADELDSLLDDDGKAHYSRSKDAGKTCKERFSYSSFDAGATVLKASPGTKNPKAILVEHKDSYMLFECTAEEKYVIVELSDDILVDTIVLANFEFFSSMVRHFRVSVSDRYPVKSEKWKKLGVFEGKNARDIQPFLVENPQIWAKYVRVDFLTYYGNEYYCPVSLLRVHGTRMLESWKETEGAPEDDDSEHESLPRGYLEATTHEGPINTFESQPGVSAVNDAFFLFGISQATCPAPVVQARVAEPPNPVNLDKDGPDGVETRGTSTITSQHSGAKSTDSSADPYSPPDTNSTISTATSSMPTPPPNGGSGKKPDSTVDAPTGTAHASSSASDAPIQSKSVEPASTQSRNRTTTSSSQPTLPTVQESFFKTVSKRLQLLESNMTWSLKYVEDQSRYIQEALVQVEGRRLSEAEALLDHLNRTVHVELGALRQQYEEVWQSTVIALETQREQSQAELVALSSRLNVLADEVVFQKRMSIGQSTLLLCCLVLIIFSRSVTYAMPLVNWQPGPGSPGSPVSSRGVLRAMAGASSVGNARDHRPPASPQSVELDHRRATKPQTNHGPVRHGERVFSAGDPKELCARYETPDEDASDQAGPERPFPLYHLDRDAHDDDNAHLGGIRGIGGEKKPLPPLPE